MTNTPSTALVDAIVPLEDGALELGCRGESLILGNDRSLYLPRRNTLLVADVHAGKEHVFGRHGIPMPAGISEHTLLRLFARCDEVAAQHLVVLGDFVHAAPDADEAWLGLLSGLLDERPALTFAIVTGNHDLHADRRRLDARIVWHDHPLALGPFLLCHDSEKVAAPVAASSQPAMVHTETGLLTTETPPYLLSGHLHPMAQIGARRRSALRLPAFWFNKLGAVLPAYGQFTGGVSVRAGKHDRLFVCGPERVVPA